MTTSDWLASMALAISGGALALEIRRWFEGKPRIFLSVIRDAVEIPHGDGKPKLALTVYNRGSAPTTITHILVYIYDSRWQKLRGRRASMTALVPGADVPKQLGPNDYWLWTVVYDAKTTKAREEGELYVGVAATHTSKNFLVRVPPKKVFGK